MVQSQLPDSKLSNYKFFNYPIQTLSNYEFLWAILRKVESAIIGK